MKTDTSSLFYASNEPKSVPIANAIIELRPDAKILFVGAEGRMEMQRVPDAGYKIIGLPIAGFDRKHLWKNVSVLIKLARSQWKARMQLRTVQKRTGCCMIKAVCYRKQRSVAIQDPVCMRSEKLRCRMFCTCQTQAFRFFACICL